MFWITRNGKLNADSGLPAHRSRRFLRAGMAVGLVAAAAFTATYGQAQYAREVEDPWWARPKPAKNFDAVDAERKRQIADDSARLLKLATDLKAAVDNTSKDTLSLDVIRKAEQIEKLAHSLKQKMKLTM